MAHHLKVKIYYEDTDCGGVVYYANYLRYFERARTEFFEEKGLYLKNLMDEGTFFVVAEANLKYTAPGRYGDVLDVETIIERIGPASITFRHRVLRSGSGEKLVDATVRIGCVGRDMRPMRLSAKLMEVLAD